MRWPICWQRSRSSKRRALKVVSSWGWRKCDWQQWMSHVFACFVRGERISIGFFKPKLDLLDVGQAFWKENCSYSQLWGSRHLRELRCNSRGTAAEETSKAPEDVSAAFWIRHMEHQNGSSVDICLSLTLKCFFWPIFPFSSFFVVRSHVCP